MITWEPWSRAYRAGFAATYVFTKDITQPEKIIDLLGSAVPEFG